MKYRRFTLLILVMILLFSLAGCGIRTRVFDGAGDTDENEPEEITQMESILPPEEREETQPETTEEEQQEPEADEMTEPEEEKTPEEEPDQTAPTEEDPNAERREYSSEASAEVSPDAETDVIAQAPETDALPAPQEGDSDDSAARETIEETELDVTETVPEDTAEDLSASNDGETADTALEYYQTLLDSRLKSQFECQKLYIYWETSTDYQTVYKTSIEHQIILLSGGYDVSAKLLEDALNVDDGWIGRKNPGAVVKCVDSSVLGSGVTSTSSAQSVLSDMLLRPGWETMDAVKTETVILISDELMRSAAGQTAAAVYIAKEMYPTIFEDIDADGALKLLMEESAGTEVSGVYAYTGNS